MTNEKAQRNFDGATLQIKKCLTMRHGGLKAEISYGNAYQELERFGMPGHFKLKNKYRSK